MSRRFIISLRRRGWASSNPQCRWAYKQSVNGNSSQHYPHWGDEICYFPFWLNLFMTCKIKRKKKPSHVSSLTCLLVWWASLFNTTQRLISHQPHVNLFCLCPPGWQSDLSQVQRCQGGGPVESDQLLRLQHADLCPGCEPAGQIPGYDEGTWCSHLIGPDTGHLSFGFIRVWWHILAAYVVSKCPHFGSKCSCKQI